ncbi:phospholipid:diacylglycerol acyltransferase 1 [Quercus suber]|uniref:Phospholipid:diacylglycerol acyltransferase 1 n=1 Tax=Quercus suber TaxID=58331 RepID=A0AAW0LIY9_QUESU
MSFLRRRKATKAEENNSEGPQIDTASKNDDVVDSDNKKQKLIQKHEGEESSRRRRRSSSRRWTCVDSCCWFIGCICSIWWFLLFMYNAMPASFPQYVTEAITGPLPDPPGVKLRKEGLTAQHPVVFVPGIVTGGLELWEGHQCAEGLFRRRLWGGTFGELYKRPLCWVEHMSLDNETGLDSPGIRVRPVSGLVAADYFAPGYFVWAVLIANLARIGYEEKTMYMAAYDWRLSFQNTEYTSCLKSAYDSLPNWIDQVRDQSLSRIKSNIELMVATNGGKKVVVIPHSMGVIYFLHFMKWVEAPAPMGGGGGSNWCAKHIKAVMNIGAPFLGVPKAVSGLFSIEAKDVAVASFTVRIKFILLSKILTHLWDAFKGSNLINATKCDVWTEYHEMGIEGVKAIADYKVYTAGSILDLLHYKCSRHGNLLYVWCWSSTERAYVYKLTPPSECYIPFQIDTSAEGGSEDSCLKGGVFSVDGDETVPVLSSEDIIRVAAGPLERTWVGIEFTLIFSNGPKTSTYNSRFMGPDEVLLPMLAAAIEADHFFALIEA